MTIMYAICAAVGGTILACQVVLTLLGLGDGDIPDDLPDDVPDVHGTGGGDHHHNSLFFGILTFRTAVAALTFFGLVGLAGNSSNVSVGVTLLMAVAAGFAAMYGVHWLMQLLHKLRADGTARIERSLGQAGTVYLRIPGRKAGAGKIHVPVNNQTMEYEAVTAEEEGLPFGARVVVVDVLGPNTVQVELIRETEKVSHA